MTGVSLEVEPQPQLKPAGHCPTQVPAAHTETPSWRSRAEAQASCGMTGSGLKHRGGPASTHTHSLTHSHSVTLTLTHTQSLSVALCHSSLCTGIPPRPASVFTYAKFT
jgi:hypothetical protein